MVNDTIYRPPLQQDGTAPHYISSVRRFLDTRFSGQWVGRRGLVDRPAETPLELLYVLGMQLNLQSNKLIEYPSRTQEQNLYPLCVPPPEKYTTVYVVLGESSCIENKFNIHHERMNSEDV